MKTMAALVLHLILLVSLAQSAAGPGEQWVDIGTHKLHVRVQGTGSPAIVIDTGLTDPLDRVVPLQERLAARTRVVIYDRAGYGQSGPGPLPRSSQRAAAEIHAMLSSADISPPYILVGHSLGGLNMQAFAATYPKEIAGMILLDPPPLSFLLGQVHPELKTMADAMTAEWQAIADSCSMSSDPSAAARAVFFRTIASEHREMFGESAISASRISSFAAIPLVVVAAGRANPAFGPSADDFQKSWIGQNRALATKSLRGEFVLADQATHYVYLDAPALVDSLILGLVDRAGSP